ncbi:MAG: transketolase [Clostridia bacterium]|nr:transketolase [Clostridia bacterium]
MKTETVKKRCDFNAYETAKAAAEIRKLCIRSLASIGSGHIGGSMSVSDILAVLYTDIMHIDPKRPDDESRDWLVMSKGHCGSALYATLAYKGYFKKEELLTLNKGGTKLPSHCDRLKTVGIDISTGSLGQGLSLAAGVAYGKILRGIGGRVYAILGDGELQEGQNWEAFQFIAHRNVNNLITIIDNNRRQLDGYTEDICNPFGLKNKFEAFGLIAEEVDGHDVTEIYNALKTAENAQKPVVLVCNTEKGHGCNFAEIRGFNHYMPVTEELAESAAAEIDRRLEENYGRSCR